MLGGAIVVHGPNPRPGTIFGVVAVPTVLAVLALRLLFILKPPNLAKGAA
jgi:hypothetical protein